MTWSVSTAGCVYHSAHVFSDRLGSLHRVDGDLAGLLHVTLTFEALLKLLQGKVQIGVVMMCPLKRRCKKDTGSTDPGTKLTMFIAESC